MDSKFDSLVAALLQKRLWLRQQSAIAGVDSKRYEAAFGKRSSCVGLVDGYQIAFRQGAEEIEEALHDHGVEAPAFDAEAFANEYRESLAAAERRDREILGVK